MTVKANWFAELDDGPASQIDPFAAHAEQLGLEIDLRDPKELQQQLRDLLNAEAALYERKVTCSIRDRSDTSCTACPVRRTNSLDRLTPLCDVGIQMERVTTTLAAHAIEPDLPKSAVTD